MRLLIFLSFFLLNIQYNYYLNQISKFELEINLLNIKNNGTVWIAIYNNDLDFDAKDDNYSNIQFSIIEKVNKGNFSKKIILNEGIYAFKVFIDDNGNDKFDYNFIGFPKEQYGFSNNVIKILGPPNFSEASFNLSSNKKIEIKLR